MPADTDARALALARLVLRAALEPEHWPDFLGALSEELGGPAISMNLEIPGVVPARQAYRIHSDPRYAPVFADYATRDALPWRWGRIRSEEFHDGRDDVRDEDLVAHPFYRDYMEPQGFHPEAPTGLVFGIYAGRPTAALGIYRRLGCRALDDADRALLRELVPFLDHAYQVHLIVGRERQQREAMAEAIDHFATGVVLLDESGRAVSVSRSAQQIAARGDGFSLGGGIPRATAADSGPALRAMVDRALDHTGEDPPAEEPIAIERPSGRRSFVALAISLRNVPRVDYARDAVAALFVTDPDQGHDHLREHLASIYALTPAEADLAAMLCLGRSLEEAASARRVTLNTARGQLKQVFAKTGTSRQPELVRMALASFSGIIARSDARAGLD